MASDYPIINGKITIFGNRGGITLTGWLTSMTPNAQTFDFERTVEEAVLKDTAGHTVSRIFHSPKETLTVKCIPTDPTGAGGTDTALLGTIAIPSPGLVATIANSAASINGTWNVVSGSINSESNGFMSLTLKLDRVAEKNGVGGGADSLPLVTIA